MLLRSLTVNNIGVYRGRQTLLFSMAKTRPVTLIGGKNGTGKTSLMAAIPLVLYGGRIRRALNGSSYPQHLNSLVHHGERTASMVLEFDRAEEGRQVRYAVERTWDRTSRGRPSERLYVSTDGDPRPDLAAAWPGFVEGIMPMAVADLAIFDNERIQSLADPVSSAEVLRTSLYALMGLDLVDRLRDDLRSYRRREAKTHDSLRAPQLTEQLAQCEAQLAATLTDVESASQALNDAASAAADLESQLHKAQDKLARAGGGLLTQRDDLHRRLGEANASAVTVEQELLLLASSDLPLALVPDLIKLVAAAGEQGEASRRARQERSTMEERDARLAEQLIGALGLAQAKGALVRDVFRTDLESIEQPASPNFLPTLECADAARSLLHQRLPNLQGAAKRLTRQLDVHNTEAAHLEATLEAAPDAHSAAAAVEAVAIAEADLRAAKKSVQRARAEFDDAERRAVQARREVDAIAHALLDTGAADQNAARIAREVTAADEALAEFAAHMVRKHLSRITKEINTALAKLLRKQGLVSGVFIDPEDLTIMLLNPKRQRVDPHRLSAGERQMTATAVLWGLSRCTGMTLPTVIDTPVGRLDRSHRTNLVERYFPNASRQVVLFSTDEEIVGDHLQQLRPHVGAQYWLDFDEAEACTYIREGYVDE